VLELLQLSARRPFDPPRGRLVPFRPPELHAGSGDAVQDALVDAVAAVVARVGLERATASRIARRAGMTSGAIYGRYASKEDLLVESLDTLLAPTIRDGIVTHGDSVAAPDPGAELSRALAGLLGPARREWRCFRVEAQLAARHHPRIAASMHRVQEEGLREYLASLGAQTDDARAALDVLGRVSQVAPIGLALTDLVVPGISGIDWRLALGPMLARPG
jgi:AcrR family transcriptional regulator